jgi:hypothetical protein
LSTFHMTQFWNQVIPPLQPQLDFTGDRSVKGHGSDFPSSSSSSLSFV